MQTGRAPAAEDANSLNTDPLFVNLEDTPPNFDTIPSSPAVGAGSTSLSCSVGWCDPNGSSPDSIYGSTDFLGNPRTNGSSIDIGAYENTGAAIANSLTVALSSGRHSPARSGDHSDGYGVRQSRWRRCSERYGELHAGVKLAGKANAAADQRHEICGKYAAQCVATRARRQHDNGSVLGKFDRAVLYSIGTAGRIANPVPWYPSANSSPIAVTFSGSPGIYSPVASSALTSAPTSFQWFGYPGATAYSLDIGKEQGGNEYYQSGSLSSSTISQTVSSLPSDGSTVWARWYYLTGGTWQFTDYSYTALGGSASKGAITSPAPGSTLTGASVAFTWTPGTGATAYWIDAGSSVGGSQYYKSGNLNNTITATVPGLPTNGTLVYITLYSLVGGQWFSNAYQYTAFNAEGASGMMTAPTSGSTLTGGSVTFQWSAGSGATAYWLDVGSTAGANNYYQSRSLSSSTLQATVSGLPTDGSMVYATLYSLIGGTWTPNAYTYYALNAASDAATMVSPTGPSLSGNAATFTWTAGTGATAYWLDIGSTPGGNNYSQSGSLNTQSTMVSSLPANGSTIYVTLYSLVGGQWVSNSYTYVSGP